jgi:hypothetical protein
MEALSWFVELDEKTQEQLSNLMLEITSIEYDPEVDEPDSDQYGIITGIKCKVETKSGAFFDLFKGAINYIKGDDDRSSVSHNLKKFIPNKEVREIWVVELLQLIASEQKSKTDPDVFDTLVALWREYV